MLPNVLYMLTLPQIKGNPVCKYVKSRLKGIFRLPQIPCCLFCFHIGPAQIGKHQS